MKLAQYYKKEDFGTEHVFVLLKGKNRSLVQLGLSFDDYASFPYLQISFGRYYLIDILFSCWRFGLALEILSSNWDQFDKRLDDLLTGTRALETKCLLSYNDFMQKETHL